MNIEVDWLGVVDYDVALRLQRERRDQIVNDQASDVIWLLEHAPVVTTGRRTPEDLPSAEVFEARGISMYRTERGGLATYHGPGQLVCYLLFDRRRHRVRLVDVVRALEEAQISWLAARGVTATRREKHPGVWVGTDKIGSVGLHERRGVTMHGMALNLCVDLEPFSLFVPCGVRDAGVTSLLRETGLRVLPRDAGSEIANRLLWTLLEFQR
ncbi:MAG: lipoate-protein ligase B [Kiritimatiellia bacterium]